MTSTGVRFLAWIRRNLLLFVTTVVAAAFVAFVIVAAQAVNAESRARLVAVERLAAENRRIAAENVEQDREQCEGINGVNATVRFVLDGSIRNRSPGAPISDAARQLTVDTYRQLPHTDCITGARTYFEPPFP